MTVVEKFAFPIVSVRTLPGSFPPQSPNNTRKQRSKSDPQADYAAFMPKPADCWWAMKHNKNLQGSNSAALEVLLIIFQASAEPALSAP